MPTLRYAQMFDALVTGLELMPSGKGFVMSDSRSHLVLWGSPSKLPFTEFSKPTEFADAPALSKHLDWAADLPFNLIGMPYYREALL
ncbi:poly(A)-specific ribonuclease, partial [Teratosphaeriaceae sp. CCFEE 6253]